MTEAHIMSRKLAADLKKLESRIKKASDQNAEDVLIQCCDTMKSGPEGKP